MRTHADACCAQARDACQFAGAALELRVKLNLACSRAVIISCLGLHWVNDLPVRISQTPCLLLFTTLFVLRLVSPNPLV